MQIQDVKHESAPFSVPEGMGKILIELGVAEPYSPPQPSKSKASTTWQLIEPQAIGLGKYSAPAIECRCLCDAGGHAFHFEGPRPEDDCIYQHQSKCEATRSRPPLDLVKEYLRMRKIFYKRRDEAIANASNDPLQKARAGLRGR